MSWRVHVLATPATAAGFRLAGLSVDEVQGGAEVEARLARAAQEADLGVLLVEEELLAQISETARRLAEQRAVPILVPIPAPQWGAKPDAESFILELLQHAIGYRVRLQ